MADHAGLAARVERQDHGWVHQFELGVVVPDLGGLLAEQLPVAGDGGVQVLDVQGYMKRVVGHEPILLHRSSSMVLHGPSTSVNIELCRSRGAAPGAVRRSCGTVCGMKMPKNSQPRSK